MRTTNTTTIVKNEEFGNQSRHIIKEAVPESQNSVEQNERCDINTYSTAAIQSEAVSIQSNFQSQHFTATSSTASTTTPNTTQQKSSSLHYTPTKLYFRDDDIRTLQGAFGKIHQCSQIVVIHGESGTGKTSLARCLIQKEDSNVDNTTNFFYSERKFDQLQHLQPYPALVTALTNLTYQIDNDEKETLAKAIRTNPDDLEELAVLADIVPMLQDIVPKTIQSSMTTQQKSKTSVQYDPAHIQPCTQIANQNRFQNAIYKFISYIVTSIHKNIVLFFDDIQWASEGDFDLICQVSHSMTTIPGILFIFAYRDSEIDSNKKILLEEIQHGITDIKLEMITKEQTQSIVADSLHSEDICSISQVIWETTQGNLFFIEQYLRIFHDSKNNSVPTNIETRYSSSTKFSSLQNLMYSRLPELTPTAQECFKILSCFGNTVPYEIAKHVVPAPQSSSMTIMSVFEEIQQYGWLRFDEHKMVWMFSHDTIQEFAYQSIPVDERMHYHLKIGKKLWTVLDMKELELNIFIVVGQLVLAKPLISLSKERIGVAKLLLVAGERAVQCSAFITARSYILHGIDLLDSRSWRDDYELCLELHSAAAECSFSSGFLPTVFTAKARTLEYARCFEDTFRVRIISLNARSIGEKVSDAREEGIQFLKLLGEKFPRKPTKLHCLLALQRTRRNFRQKSDEEIMNLPVMTDPWKLATMQALHFTFTSARLTDLKLSVLIGNRMANITLDHGVSGLASLTLTIVGAILCNFGAFEEGCRLGYLAWAIYEKFPNRSFLPRFYAVYFRYIHSWKNLEFECSEPLWYGYKVGMQTGDIEYGMICGLFSFFSRFCHVPLQECKQGLESLKIRMKMLSLDGLLTVVEPMLAGINNLIGPVPGSPKELECQENSDKNAKAVRSVSPWYFKASYLIRLINLYLFVPDCDKALVVAKASREVTDREFSLAFCSWLRLLDSLCCIAHSQKSNRNNELYAQRCTKVLEKWASFGSDTYRSKYLLLKAELSFLQWKRSSITCSRYKTKRSIEDILNEYDSAIDLCRQRGFLFENALCHERACKFLFEVGNLTKGEQYSQEAVRIYHQWGATAKVQHLEDEVKQYILGTT